MLCPMCGADVGQTVTLCDKCKASRPADSEDILGKFGKPEAKGNYGEAEKPNNVKPKPKSVPGKSKEHSGKNAALVGGLLSALVILLGLILYFLLSENGEPPKPRAPLESTEPPAASLDSPQFSTAVTETTLAEPPRETSAGHLVAGRTSVNFGHARALFFPGENRLEIGFFAETPAEDIVSQAKKEGSFKVSSDTGPLASVQMLFAQGAKRCTLDSLSSYSVTISKRSPLNILSNAPSVIFIRRGSAAAHNEIPELDCMLGEEENLMLRLFEPGAVDPISKTLFSWHLKASVKIDDISREHKNGPAPEPAPQVSLPENTIAAGQSQLQLRGSLALFHAKHNRLEIGLYAEALSESQVKSAAGKLSVRSAVAAKSPLVIIGIKFRDDSATHQKADIQEYFITFQRDTLGDFYFPGSRSFISFDRVGTNREQETIDLAGELKSGSAITLTATGKDKSSRPSTPFEWNLKFNVPVLVVDD